MAEPRPILILAASTGAGHLVAARGIEEALRSVEPEATVQTADVLAWTNRLFRGVYAGGYLRMIRSAPWLMGALYDATNAPGAARGRLRRWMQTPNLASASRRIMSLRPRLVINTHFLPAELCGRLRDAGRLDCPCVTVCTDIETHAMWFHPRTDLYCVATELGRAHLVACGASAERVQVTGLPVRADFETPISRDEARERLGLSSSPLILLLGGGFGVGPTEMALRELARSNPAAQIAIIAGRNPRLQQRLAQIANGARVVGYTDEMHLWMRASELVVTKTGGLTCAEALVCGAPMVVVRPIPGPEMCNADYLVEHGAAIKVNTLSLLGMRAAELLADGSRLAKMRDAALALARPGAARRIAQASLDWIRPGRNQPVN